MLKRSWMKVVQFQLSRRHSMQRARNADCWQQVYTKTAVGEFQHQHMMDMVVYSSVHEKQMIGSIWCVFVCVTINKWTHFWQRILGNAKEKWLTKQFCLAKSVCKIIKKELPGSLWLNLFDQTTGMEEKITLNKHISWQTNGLMEQLSGSHILSSRRKGFFETVVCQSKPNNEVWWTDGLSERYMLKPDGQNKLFT